MHIAVEESEQKRSDVRSIHISIRHNNDFMIPEVFKFEFLLMPNAGSKGSNHRLDFLVLENLVDFGFLNIQNFTSKRQDGLVSSISAHLSGSAGRVTLNQVHFTVFGIFNRAVGQFTGKSAATHYAFTLNQLTCFTCGFTCFCRDYDFFENFLGCFGILFEILVELFIYNNLYSTLNL